MIQSLFVDVRDAHLGGLDHERLTYRYSGRDYRLTDVAGQFGLGLLLGAVWSPCVGPTLGAASVLAAKGEDLLQVALTMLAFGVGAALPNTW